MLSDVPSATRICVLSLTTPSVELFHRIELETLPPTPPNISMPAAPAPAVLSVIVLLVTLSLALLLAIPPARLPALLPASRQFISVVVPPRLYMQPPSVLALL